MLPGYTLPASLEILLMRSELTATTAVAVLLAVLPSEASLVVMRVMLVIRVLMLFVPTVAVISREAEDPAAMVPTVHTPLTLS